VGLAYGWLRLLSLVPLTPSNSSNSLAHAVP
jgi:hypothetical protein